jgi:hypothetical protein
VCRVQVCLHAHCLPPIARGHNSLTRARTHARAYSVQCEVAAALVEAIANNDVDMVRKYVTRRGDCNLHTGIFPPLTLAAAEGNAEICRLLLSGGAEVHHAVPVIGGGGGGAWGKDIGAIRNPQTRLRV